MFDKSRRELAAVLTDGALAVGIAGSAQAYQGKRSSVALRTSKARAF
jgi:hypothetical protein